MGCADSRPWSAVLTQLLRGCCRPDQVMEEVSACLRMLDEVYAVFGLTYKAALSTRPPSYLGTLDQWDAAEAALRTALDQTGQEWEVRQRLP